ncbi:MAG: hypothetical protein PV344_03825 [Anaplasma sp.]|nr:hypothetical protein [Anaplasma sp.]
MDTVNDLIFAGSIFTNRAKAENSKLFAGFNFRESNVASVLLTYCPNCSRDLFFANRGRFAKFAKIGSSRKFSRLQYVYMECFF